ncbi:MAG: extracellular solute-binding protein [Clostridia bacterium]|nr:extracellular solute-binding protein [Clostridia bacterium]
MKRSFIRVISALLLAVMLISAVACAETPEDPSADTTEPVEAGTNDPAETVIEETTAINAENLLGIRDLSGETLTFFSRIYNGPWGSDLFVEDMDGTVLNDAIYRRNTTLAEKYGIEFEEIESGNITFRDSVGNRISSGDTSYQVLYMGLADAAHAAQSGYLQDITEMENINLGAQWWTQSSNKAWSMGNRQYFATGAITTTDDRAIRTMYFNKDIIADLQLTTIYDLVYANEWVYEKFFEYVEAAKRDDGDGVATLSDVYGASAQVTFGFMMTMASGELLTQKDADDFPFLVATDNTRFIDVVTYLTDRIANNDGIYLGADQDIRDLFGNGQSLFWAEVLEHAQTMRQNYDLNFGIIPMPKYTSEQENYHQYTTGYCTTVICFPTTTKGTALDVATFMVEAMAIESVETVTPAYYDICLKGRYIDDPDSAGMLDIITTSVYSDYAEIYSWGGFKEAIQSAISAGVAVSSVIKANAPMTRKALQRSVEAFQKLP